MGHSSSTRRLEKFGNKEEGRPSKIASDNIKKKKIQILAKGGKEKFYLGGTYYKGNIALGEGGQAPLLLQQKRVEIWC